MHFHCTLANKIHDLKQGVYKFNQANFQEIPGGILRKIQDMFALLRIWGSVISSPTGVQGGAPAENGFWCIWNSKKHI